MIDMDMLLLFRGSGVRGASRVIKCVGLVTLIGTLCSCAVSEPQVGFAGERTVFHNPYAAQEFENGPVGPDQCAECPGNDGRWLDGLFYPGAGHYAFDRSGNRVPLSREDRRELRLRNELIGDQAEINRKVAEFDAHQAAMLDRPLPQPSAPPTALPAQAEPSVDREMPR